MMFIWFEVLQVSFIASMVYIAADIVVIVVRGIYKCFTK